MWAWQKGFLAILDSGWDADSLSADERKLCDSGPKIGLFNRWMVKVSHNPGRQAHEMLQVSVLRISGSDLQATDRADSGERGTRHFILMPLVYIYIKILDSNKIQDLDYLFVTKILSFDYVIILV